MKMIHMGILGIGLLTAHSFGLGLQQNQSAPTDKQENPFKDGFVGHGRFSDGTLLDISSEKAEDGATVGLTHGTFKSSDAANKEMQHWVSKGKLISSSTIEGSHGQTIGHRFVLSLALEAQSAERFVVSWTRDADFFWIASTSLKDALQMEKKVNKEFSPKTER